MAPGRIRSIDDAVEKLYDLNVGVIAWRMSFRSRSG
jgi:hypothetical protein